MNIIFEDNEIIVCEKPVGISSENEFPALIKEHTKGEVFTVHRLDAAVSGVIIYAKTKSAAAFLSKEIAEKRFVKKYLAVVEGETKEYGEFEDFLFKDSKKNKVFVVKNERKGVKYAHLFYETLDKKDGLSLVKITLDTGRTHQIRVQFASRKMPLFADGKYGSKKNGQIGLFSHSLTFTHPKTKENLTFTATPHFPPFTFFD